MRSVRESFVVFVAVVVASAIGFGSVNAQCASIDKDKSVVAWNLPVDNQIIQRESSGNGKVQIQFSGGADGNVVVKLQSENNRIKRELTVPLVGGNGQGAFVDIPPGMYVLATEASGKKESRRIGVGDVYIVAGQSNALSYFAGHAWPRSDTNKVSANMAAGMDMQTGNALSVKRYPDLDHFFMPVKKGRLTTSVCWFACGDMLVRNFGVPIGFVNVAVGGSNSSQWLPGGKNFALLAEAATRYPCRAVLWVQGESDVRNLSQEKSYENLVRIISETQKITKAPWVVALTSCRVDSPGSEAPVRQAQKQVISSKLALQGPDTDTLRYVPGYTIVDGLELVGPGLDQYGKMWYEVLKRYIVEKRI